MEDTIINPSPRSSNPHSRATCKIPAGSGFGGRKSRVTIGAKVLSGRNVCRRCVTGPLALSRLQSLHPSQKCRLDGFLGTHSKFRVQRAILTPRRSRWSISSVRPGCGSWDSMAVDSMARMVAWAEGCWEEGRESMCERMSTDGWMERADLSRG